MICPACGVENDDNWPITVNGNIVDGGCQMCWEKESDRKWWEGMVAIDMALKEGRE